jgi:hypothetical protein
VLDDEHSKSKHSVLLQKQSEEEFKKFQQQHAPVPMQSNASVAEKHKEKKTSPLDGNLAMKFLLKSGDFDSIMNKGKKDTIKKTH